MLILFSYFIVNIYFIIAFFKKIESSVKNLSLMAVSSYVIAVILGIYPIEKSLYSYMIPNLFPALIVFYAIYLLLLSRKD